MLNKLVKFGHKILQESLHVQTQNKIKSKM
jgi:hypothetical protein